MRTVEIVACRAECDAIESRVIASASRTVDTIKQLLIIETPLKAFAKLKFDTTGFHPVEYRSLNLIEQLNQTFTYLASLRAACWLLERHGDAAPFRLNLGTAPGSDIESVDGTVAAETFASVSPKNNGKLDNDIAKVGATNALYKYVFYICPSHAATPLTAIRGDDAVKVISLGW